MNLRTDLAVELLDQFSKKTKVKEEVIDSVKITSVLIAKEDAVKIGKADGHYMTLEFGDIRNNNISKKVIDILKDKLKLFVKNKNKILIVGLGNDKSTPDALGPLTLKYILVNAPLIDMGYSNDSVKTYAFEPSVMGKTGIETSDIIKLLVGHIKPDLVLIVDALASSSVERLNHTIQINNVGIMPGSGVGNKRKEITKNNLGVDIVALGVPTVVDSATIVSDTIDYMYKYFAYNKKDNSNLLMRTRLYLGAVNLFAYNNLYEADKMFAEVGSSLTENDRYYATVLYWRSRIGTAGETDINNFITILSSKPANTQILDYSSTVFKDLSSMPSYKENIKGIRAVDSVKPLYEPPKNAVKSGSTKTEEVLK